MSPHLQDDTPQPKKKDVYIHKTPSATFYVSQYGGYSMDDITVSKHVCFLSLAVQYQSASMRVHCRCVACAT